MRASTGCSAGSRESQGFPRTVDSDVIARYELHFFTIEDIGRSCVAASRSAIGTVLDFETRRFQLRNVHRISILRTCRYVDNLSGSGRNINSCLITAGCTANRHGSGIRLPNQRASLCTRTQRISAQGCRTLQFFPISVAITSQCHAGISIRGRISTKSGTTDFHRPGIRAKSRSVSRGRLGI